MRRNVTLTAAFPSQTIFMDRRWQEAKDWEGEESFCEGRRQYNSIRTTITRDLMRILTQHKATRPSELNKNDEKAAFKDIVEACVAKTNFNS